MQQSYGQTRPLSPRRVALLLERMWQGARESPPGPLATAVLSAVYLLFVGFGVLMYMRSGR